MKHFIKFTFATIFALALISCGDDDGETIIIDSSLPQGDFTASVTGSFTADAAPTSGMVEIGMDAEGTEFLRLADNFSTNVGTGAVAIYLSTSDTFTADPPNGNPDLQLVGSITTNGENFFELDPEYDSKFTHVIAWCTSVGVQFGNAPIN